MNNTGNSPFVYSNDGTVLLKYNGNDSIVNVPKGTKVIGKGAFFFKTKITEITIPETVTLLEEDCFSNCICLKKLVIGKGITVLPRKMCNSCTMLEEVEIKGGITQMDKETFADCKSLKSVIINCDGLSVSVADFKPSEEITLLGTPSEIHLENDTYISAAQVYFTSEAIQSAALSKNAYKESDRLHDGKPLFTAVYNSEKGDREIDLEEIEEEVTLEETTDERHFDENGFCINDGVLEAYNGNEVFLEIPTQVTKIADGAFYASWSLMSVHIPDTVTEIGNGAFKGCANLSKLTGLKGVVTIGNDAFAESGIKSIVFPKKVKTIGKKAFCDCNSLEKAEFLGKISEISDNAFSGCGKLRSIELCGDSLSLGDGCFADCVSLKCFECTGTLQTIGGMLFAGCTSLENVIYPQKSTASTAHHLCYKDCKALREITLPMGTSMISGAPFDGCDSLEIIHVLSKNIMFMSDALPHFIALCTENIPINELLNSTVKLMASLGYMHLCINGNGKTLASKNDKYIDDNHKELIARLIRTIEKPSHFEILCQYILLKGYATAQNIKALLSINAIAENESLYARLCDYYSENFAHLEKSADNENVDLISMDSKKPMTPLRHYLGSEEFESGKELVNAMLSSTFDATAMHEMVVYVTKNELLDRDDAQRLLDRIQGFSDVATRVVLVSYIGKHGGGGILDLLDL